MLVYKLKLSNNTEFNLCIDLLDTPYLIEPPHLSSLIADDKMIEHLNNTLSYMKTLIKENDHNYFNSTEYAKLERVVRWIEHNR